MSKAEITATEKLLDLIREDGVDYVKEDISLSMESHPVNHPQTTKPDPVIPVNETKDQKQEESSPPQTNIASPVKETTESLPVSPDINVDNPQIHRPKSNYQSQAAKSGIVSKLTARKSQVTIGIDIQWGYIHFVKFSKKTNDFLDSHTEPAAQQPPAFKLDDKQKITDLLTDNQFKETLRAALNKFCNSDKHPEIWCSLGALNIGLHNIIIPKVKESEIANAVFWSAKKTIEFDPKKEIFDFSILKEIKDHETTKLLTLVTLVPQDDINSLKSFFKDIGFTLSGVSYPPAATQNLLNYYSITNTDDAVVHLRLKEDNSFIDLFCNNQMIFSREIKTDTSSFIESCQEHASELGIDLDETMAVNLLFRDQNHLNTTQTDFNDIRTKINLAELPVLDRLNRQLNRTFEYCGSHFQIPKINTLCISGEFIFQESILSEIQKRLDIKCKILPPFRLNHVTTASDYAINLNTAAGLALATKSNTKNFLYTHEDRKRDKLSRKINQIISVITIIVALLTGGLIFQQYQTVSARKITANQLNKQLVQSYQASPRSKNDIYILQAIAELKDTNRNNKIKIERFQVLAGLSELNSIIPAQIKLTSLVIAKSNNKGRQKGKKNKKHNKTKKMWLKGFVKGDVANQDFELLNFIKELSKLTLAQKPILLNKKRASAKHDVTKFTIELAVNYIGAS